MNIYKRKWNVVTILGKLMPSAIFLYHLHSLGKNYGMNFKINLRGSKKWKDDVTNKFLNGFNINISFMIFFRSADENIDLVPLEEFYANAPSSLSCQNFSDNNYHELRLARLTWEMMERKKYMSLRIWFYFRFFSLFN